MDDPCGTASLPCKLVPFGGRGSAQPPIFFTLAKTRKCPKHKTCHRIPAKIQILAPSNTPTLLPLTSETKLRQWKLPFLGLPCATSPHMDASSWAASFAPCHSLSLTNPLSLSSFLVQWTKSDPGKRWKCPLQEILMSSPGAPSPTAWGAISCHWAA